MAVLVSIDDAVVMKMMMGVMMLAFRCIQQTHASLRVSFADGHCE